MEDRVERIEQALAGMYVLLARVYDVLVVSLPPEHRERLVELHSEGDLLGTPPFMSKGTYARWSDDE